MIISQLAQTEQRVAKRRFPTTFWWGTAASSPQSEGAAPDSDWAAWERAGRAPSSGQGNGFATRYVEDFVLYADHGLTHHRLGLEWARIEPSEGHRDPQAIAHYHDMLHAAREAGIHAWVCLHHFALPAWLAPSAVGFVDERARTYHWRRHLEFIADTFGDLVFGWQPVNEPVVYSANGFLGGVSPPGANDWELAMRALEAAHLAEIGAWSVLRHTGKPIATIQALFPLHPCDDSPAASSATEALDAAVWGWARAVREGVLAVPGRRPLEVPEFRNAFDLIGFSYYHAASVSRDATLLPYPADARVGPLGYAPWSDGLGLVLDRLAAELPDKPLLVAEHGVGTDDDDWRADVLQGSLHVVADRLDRGIDVRGFFHWTGVDNYEWGHGFGVPFGLFDRNRRPRPSAELIRAVARSGSLEVNE